MHGASTRYELKTQNNVGNVFVMVMGEIKSFFLTLPTSITCKRYQIMHTLSLTFAVHVI